MSAPRDAAREAQLDEIRERQDAIPRARDRWEMEAAVTAQLAHQRADLSWCIAEIVRLRAVLAGASPPSEMQTRFEEMCEVIRRADANGPPYYAYGDNEAACWMAHQLQELALLLPPSSAPPTGEEEPT